MRPQPTPSTARAEALVASIQATFIAAGQKHSTEAIHGAAHWLTMWGEGQNDLAGVNKALECSADPEDRGLRCAGRECLAAYLAARVEIDGTWRAAYLRQQAARLEYHIEVAERAGEQTLRFVRALKADPTLAGTRIKIAALRMEADALCGQGQRAA